MIEFLKNILSPSREVSVTELERILSGINKPTKVSIVARTNTRLPKSNPHYGAVKVSRSRGRIAASYKYDVRMATNNPKFKPGTRMWGRKQKALVTHKGKTYLAYHRDRVLSESFYHEGREVDLKIKERKSPVAVRNYGLDSIESLKLGRVVYTVK